MVWYYVQEHPDRDYHYQLVRVIRQTDEYINYLNVTNWLKNSDWVMAVPDDDAKYPNDTPPCVGAHGPLEKRVLLDNIAEFAVFAYRMDASGKLHGETDYDATLESPKPDYYQELPVFADIYILTLSEDDAIKTAALAAVDGKLARDYADVRGHRYAARVYFENRQALLIDKTDGTL